jgi:hypothetical protein
MKKKPNAFHILDSMRAFAMVYKQWTPTGVEGHEAMLRGSRPTKEQIEAAKAKIAPGTWDALLEARTLVESLKRQIVRLGGSDFEAASRAYTLMSGS